MVVTVEWMRANYNKYNRMLFGGKLPEINFVINNRLKSYAIANFRYKIVGDRCNIVPERIQMTSYRDSDEKYHIGTLVHEMIHIEDYTFHPERYILININGKWKANQSYDAHGEWFLGEAERINSMNLGFTVTVEGTDEEEENTVLSDEFKAKYEKQAKKGFYVAIREYNESYSKESNSWGDVYKFSRKRFDGHINANDYIYGDAYYRRYFSKLYFCICHSPELGQLSAEEGEFVTKEKADEYIAMSEVIKTVVVPESSEINERHISIINTAWNLFENLYRRKRTGTYDGSPIIGVDPLTRLNVEVGMSNTNVYLCVYMFGSAGNTRKIIFHSGGPLITKNRFSTPQKREELAKDLATTLERKGLKLECMKSYKQIIRETLENYIANDSKNDVRVSGVPGQRMYEREISDNEGEFAIE